MSIFTINGKPVKYGNKWLANGGTPSGELPPYDSSDAGKSLVVNNEGDNVEWQVVGSSGTVDQHYDGTSTNAQSGTAVAEAISTKQDTISDLSDIRSGAALGATAVQPGSLATVATTGDYNDLTHLPTIPAAVTVDQHYSSSSTNPQSGTAVAEALQTVETLPSSSSSDVNKVLTVNNQGEPEWMSAQGGSDIFIADSTTTSEEMYQAYLAGKVLFYKDSTYGLFNVFGKTYPGECSFQGYHASTTNSDLRYGNFVTAFMKKETIYNGHVSPQSNIFSYNLSFHETRVLDTPALPGNAGKILAVNGTATAVEWVAAPTLSVDQQYSSVSTNAQSGVAVAEAISGVSQVPSSTAADENKVLTVNSSGNAEWATPSGGTTYTQGNMISLANNQIAVSTTAGVTDIQFVNALPANPVATVLYLIPAV